MRFVRVDELTKGMRLAKPIYNKNGVLLYDRDTKLTNQGIHSIKNFKLIGIYILEPAEPLPPMTQDDIEFERFQTMSVFGLKEDLENLIAGKKPVNIMGLIKSLVKRYAKRSNKVNFFQNLRSCDDYVYKHSINVAILAALMGARLRISVEDMKDMVYAALVHDIGKLYIPQEIVEKSTLTEEDKKTMALSEARGDRYLQEVDFFNENIKEILKRLTVQSISYDKLNMLRHVKYFKNLDGIKAHMQKHAKILKPKFDAVIDTLNADLSGLEIAEWNEPNGGYFISLDVTGGSASRVGVLCKEAGVTLTNVGATFPYGKDPGDSNIRIAPTFPSADVLKQAVKVLTVSVRLACLENLMK